MSRDHGISYISRVILIFLLGLFIRLGAIARVLRKLLPAISITFAFYYGHKAKKERAKKSLDQRKEEASRSLRKKIRTNRGYALIAIIVFFFSIVTYPGENPISRINKEEVEKENIRQPDKEEGDPKKEKGF